MPHPPTSAIQSYRDLRVWELAMDLVVASYQASKSFPKEERYGLTAQLRRAAVSIPSNIAEGHGRKHLGDYLHQLSIANGSLMELETQIEIARRLDYIDPADQEVLMRQAGNIGRMLAGLFAALKRPR